MEKIMKDIYDYNKNIQVSTTPAGDKVVTMNEAILTSICNRIFDAAMKKREEGLEATAEDTLELWKTLIEKRGK